MTLPALAPLLLSLGLLAMLLLLDRPDRIVPRAVAAGFAALLVLRYLWWRYAHGFPLGQAPWQEAWAGMFLGLETLSIASAVLSFLFLSRRIDRSVEATAAMRAPCVEEAVDILIATYNEPLDVLERTIVGALAVVHPDLRVFVLDDGSREWVRALAEELGAHYLARTERSHAKAGNVNNGLRHVLSHGRPPSFVLLLDADFVPDRMILRRTLGLFADPSVGIVQTPQHFFNPDPIQSNLLCARVWPDEQRFFFDTMLASKDAWGVPFCCGTSAVIRARALAAIGGLAHETVTEDMLTTFKMEAIGYRTIFLNERLSLGLAPEGLAEYVGQRTRWCLGAIQQIYTRWSFFGRAKLRPIARISILDGLLYWLSAFPFKIVMMLAPVLFWWTGTSVIAGTPQDLLIWLAPSALASAVFMAHVGNRRVLPVMTDATQLVAAVALVRTIAVGLARPFGQPFRVTAKGLSTERVTVQWSIMLPLVAVALATFGGIWINIAPTSGAFGRPGFTVNLFWSVFNIMVLAIASAVCVELPRRRRSERFLTTEPGSLVFDSGETLPCRLTDLSVAGASLMIAPGAVPTEEAGRLDLADGIEVPFRAVRTRAERMAVVFDPDPTTRRALIRKLYTGHYVPEVEQVKLRAVAAALVAKLAH
ncbi:MAG TPA: glycosyltransferase [Rhodocyclaceae bacterium]|nr:glycosyltransferase [Rhodocyclaceae bacterium]